MPIKIADRVKETSLTQGVGTLTLSEAFGGFQSFSSAIGDGNSTYYVIENESRWEVGIGTYTSSSNTLSRDTVLRSSSGTSKIDISGVAIVFCGYPADKAVIRGEDGLITESGLLTLTRDSAGNFLHMYKDDSNDRTISIYTDGNASPEWRIGVKNSPSSQTEIPSYGYMYGKDGQVGLVGNSNNSITLDNTTNFTVKHNNVSLVKASSLTGIHLNTNSAAYPAITINGAAAQSQPLTEWTDSAGDVLSVVDKDGNIGVNRSSADYEIDVQGSGRFTSVIFADATQQNTAFSSSYISNISANTASGVAISGWADSTMTTRDAAISGWAEAYVDSQNHSAVSVSGWANSTFLKEHPNISAAPSSNNSGRTYIQDVLVDANGHVTGLEVQEETGGAADILVVSGIANANVTNIASNLVEIRANSASGVVVSGIANANVTNIASNLVEIRANSASGVVISGIANTNVANIATNAADIIVVSGIAAAGGGGGGSAADILANSASGVVISGIANTNVTNIASNLVEIRANSASGVVISGIANTNSTNIASNLVEIRANSASGVVISGIANTNSTSIATNVTDIASNLVEIRANSASGVVISGIANTNVTNIATNAADIIVVSGIAEAGGGGGFANWKLTDGNVAADTIASTQTVTISGISGIVTDYVAASNFLRISAGGLSGVLQPQITTNVTNIASNLVEVRANSASGVVISGIANTNVTNIAGNLVEVRANSASGVVISGIANTNVTNIAGNLVEIRANSASGVVISGIANTNVTNIASNLVEVRANSASGVVISGIANTNVTNIAGNLVEIRANSASGAAISGWANATFITTDTNTTYTAGSGLELHGTAFQAAISGANLLATNTPTDNYVPSYDAATGKFTWVSAGASYTLPEANATTKGGIELFSNTDQSVAATAVSATASRTYGLQLNSDGQGVVNVPWVDTNTTYSVGDGGLTTNDFTTADHSKLDGIEASADVTDTANVTTAGALMDSEVTNLATVKALASGISDGNFLTANNAVADNDWLRIDGTEVEGRTDAEIKADLSLEIGTDVQAYDADLAAIAGLTSAADKGIQFTGAGSAAVYGLTAAGKALLDDADAAAQRTTLGLGSAATRVAEDTLTDGANLPDGAAIKAYGDANWAGGAGDITAVVAGDGLSGGATTGSATVDVVGGDGITANANDIAITAAQTTMTSVYNASLKMGRDAQNLIDFATTDNKIILRVNNVDEVELVENALSPVTSDGVALGTTSLQWSDLFLAEGSVINWDNGDVTLTQTGNSLALAGGNFVIPDAGTIGSASVPAAITIAAEGDVTFSKATKTAAPAAASGTSGIVVLDCDTTNHFTITVGGNITGWNFTNASVGQRIIVRVTNGASHTVAFSATGDGDVVYFPGGTEPTLTVSGGIDVYGFLCVAADTFDGFIIGQDIKA